jgi:tRNA(Ile)-lysidine synthase
LSLGAFVCCAYRDLVWLESESADVPVGALAWNGEEALAWGAGWVRFEATAGAGLSRAALARATVRELVPRWPGLAMRQAAGRPRRSFKNLCQEAGIPAWLRPHLPVLRVDGEAAWIGEIGVAGEFACGADEAGVTPVWSR